MADIKVEIDLGELERDITRYDKVIADAERVIENAKKEKEMKTQLKDYILASYTTKRKPTLFADSSLRDITKKPLVTGEAGQSSGVADFIRKYIKEHNHCSTAQIIGAYAIFKGVKRDYQLSKIISRSLARLKKAEYIKNELSGGSKRDGSIWTYNKLKMN